MYQQGRLASHACVRMYRQGRRASHACVCTGRGAGPPPHTYVPAGAQGLPRMCPKREAGALRAAYAGQRQRLNHSSQQRRRRCTYPGLLCSLIRASAFTQACMCTCRLPITPAAQPAARTKHTRVQGPPGLNTPLLPCLRVFKLPYCSILQMHLSQHPLLRLSLTSLELSPPPPPPPPATNTY